MTQGGLGGAATGAGEEAVATGEGRVRHHAPGAAVRAQDLPASLHKLASRSDVPPFYVMEVLRDAAERQRTHGDVIALCAGQPSTSAPAPVLAAAAAALADQSLGYSETLGIPPLREAVAEHYGRSGVPGLSAADIVITTGSSGGFTALFLALCGPGDKVAMARPGYPAYRNILQALGIEVVDLPCGQESRFQPTAAMLAELEAPPRALILASPSNPTGSIIDPGELERIAQWCAAHGTVLISDEIYHGISFGRSCVSARVFSPEAVVVGSVSKYFSMTGWRLGWVVAPAWLRRRLEVLLANLSICPPTLSQWAAVAAFSADAAVELEAHVQRYRANRDAVVAALTRWGVGPIAPADGAFYAYVDVSRFTADSVAWCQAVLANTGVALTPGVDFDPVEGRRMVRISLAASEAEIAEALRRLEPVFR